MKIKKKALITGITGFAGSHMAELLLEKTLGDLLDYWRERV